MRAPFEYISTLPSKGVRNTFIDSLNVWLEVPEASLETIKALVGTLHDASLMLDDIEDDSTLRRGHPAAHVVYGNAQTINAANYCLIMALNDVQKLQSPNAIIIFTGKWIRPPATRYDVNSLLFQRNCEPSFWDKAQTFTGSIMLKCQPRNSIWR